MLASIILDTFKDSEKREIAEALDDLCSPDDLYGFSSACIYAFWSVPAHKVLYIGLAKDIARRFRQHTGLVKCDVNCCKLDQITAYFADNERLGISVMVQSSLDQPTTKEDEKVIAAAIEDDAFSVDVSDIFKAEQSVQLAEGMLIEIHEQLGDQLPEWNKIRGARLGQQARSLCESTTRLKLIEGVVSGKSFEEAEKEIADEGMPFELLLNLDGSELSELNARSTLREIAENPTFCGHEILLHGVRIGVASQLLSFEQSVALQERNNPFAKDGFEEMRADGYWDKSLVIPGIPNTNS
jgi:hypothetical protein